MAAQFELEILTPERQFFVGLAEAIVLPSIDGSYGVQAGHEPVVIAVEPGELQYQIDGVWHRAAVGQGFAEIMPEYVILLAATAEHPEEIDEARARRAKERAEERLRQKQSLQEYYRSKAALARAMARLKTRVKLRLVFSDGAQNLCSVFCYADRFCTGHAKKCG